VTEGISNRKELSDTLGFDTTRMVNVWSNGESNLLVVNRLHGTLCFRRRTFPRRIMTIAVYIKPLHLRHNISDCSFPFSFKTRLSHSDKCHNNFESNDISITLISFLSITVFISESFFFVSVNIS